LQQIPDGLAALGFPDDGWNSRCGQLMLPWAAEICLDRLGRESLYEPGETDD